MELISTIDELTPERLTDILNEGENSHGLRVKKIIPTPASANPTNQAYRLEIFYEGEAPATAPKRLFLKISEPDLLFATHEVFFYTEIAAAMQEKLDHLPFPRCYHAVHDTSRQQAHILLQDLSDTHFQTEGPLPPTLENAEGMVDALAVFHAFWWEHPSLGRGIGEIRGVKNIQTMVESARRRSSQFTRFMGDRLSPDRRGAIQKICYKWPEKRFHRHTNGIGLTLVHRDAHLQNFLFPKNPKSDKVILTDWQSWRVDTGTDDLAYMMAAHWYPERRARLEMPLLERYYNRLMEYGVDNYSWEDCLYDYKASVIRIIFIFAGGWRKRRDPDLYFDRLEKCLIAYEELDCAGIM